MAILITGGAGFIAVSLAERLLARGETVVALDNLCRGSLANLKCFSTEPRFIFRQVELSDADAFRSILLSLSAIDRITEVWHLAANSDIPAGVGDPQVDLRDTFMTTFQTLVMMKEFEIPDLMFASSSAIYGDLNDIELTEDVGPLFPISNYGAMKLASEAQITAARENFLKRALLFRFPNVVGLPATHGVILDFIRRLRADPSHLQVLGNGTQRKAYLHVSDLVDAMLHLRDQREITRLAVNIGPPDPGVTVRFIAETVVAMASPAASIGFGQEDRGWVGDVPKFRYSIDLLRQHGWAPTMDSAGAVRRAVAEINQQEPRV